MGIKLPSVEELLRAVSLEVSFESFFAMFAAASLKIEYKKNQGPR